ncbi:mobile mystery protein A [Sphingopyxis sp. YR583]|uniref:mobile mystery protein A n=1 Tax=Sphingopyxis sp. YR583 TaxID=1881047 RepID=UPI0008A780EE|nr:mobile mystery protein A [Sphingopyxis sp. YR583]SEH12725.1 mobile mystery protein A [Sphingopyxis sp. YR583]
MTAIFSHTGRKRLDSKLAEFRPVSRFASPPKGWIRAIRDALGMSGTQLGRRLGMTPQGVQALEQSERHGTIKLETLRRTAEAMDCVLVYALVPRTSLEQMIEERARALALDTLGRVSHSMALEDQEVDRGLEERIEAFVAAGIRERDLWDKP